MKVQTDCIEFDGSVDPVDHAVRNAFAPAIDWVVLLKPGEIRKIQIRE